MQAGSGPLSLSGRKTPSRGTVVLRLVLLLLPATLLLAGSLRTEGQTHQLMAMGAFIQVVILCFLVLARRWWEQPIGHTATFLYLIGLAWMWMSGAVSDDWFFHLA